MPDRGKLMSQAYYERQTKLLKLIQESLGRNEMNAKDTVKALRTVGFSETIALHRVNEWVTQVSSYLFETEKAKKTRHKQQISLEKYILRMRLGKITIKKMQIEYKNKALSKEKVILNLIQSGYSQKTSEKIVDKWEEENKKNKGKNP